MRNIERDQRRRKLRRRRRRHHQSAKRRSPDHRRTGSRRKRVSVAGCACEEGSLQTVLRRKSHLRQTRSHSGSLHTGSCFLAGKASLCCFFGLVLHNWYINSKLNSK